MRHFVDPSQSNWVKLLPLVEFAINDSYQESVQAVPFVLNYGKRPHLPLDKLLKREGHLDVPDCVSAADRAESILSAVKNAKAALHAAQQRQAVAANRRRREMNIAVGDSVFLSTANIKMKFKGSPKLLPRWIGPFKVLDQINPVAFRLELPSNLKIHNVFHISLLKPVAPGTSSVAASPPTIIDSALEYEVEEIVSHRFVGHGKLQFLVKWLGYGVEHWEPEHLGARSQLCKLPRESLCVLVCSAVSVWHALSRCTTQETAQKQALCTYCCFASCSCYSLKASTPMILLLSADEVLPLATAAAVH